VRTFCTVQPITRAGTVLQRLAAIFRDPAQLQHRSHARNTRHRPTRRRQAYQETPLGPGAVLAKDISIGAKMINARVETLASKPAFKAALKHRRCLIPANGFFEWAGKAGSKQPYFICLPSGEPLAFAGLYEIWEDKKAPSGTGPYKSCHDHRHGGQRLGQGYPQPDAIDPQTGGF